MIKVQYPIGSRWVFAKYPQSEEEASELSTLARLYTSIERKGMKTGLYIIAEIPFEGKTLVVSSLERKESITAEDLRRIQGEVLRGLRRSEKKIARRILVKLKNSVLLLLRKIR